ncbi:MAG TPA: TIGR01459 family HAD-type hydrolase [Stellaceae bacterium]|nr:TIGR01459 family HAD-type hydrolase [Stellaceae bacterium]
MAHTIVSGIGAIADRYDGFILDVWGVLHDGLEPYPGVLDALARLTAAGKRVTVLSNAPARAEAVVERIAAIGIPRGAYHHILTSGEEVWQHLHRRPDAFYQGLGRHCFQIGPDRDRHMLDGLGLERTASVEAADFILNTGPWGPDDQVDNYEETLVAGAERGVPMICANPDLTVMQGSRVMICAGSLAQRYEQLGGTVRWHGKPFPSVYETSFQLLGIADRSRIAAVGDSLRTDIAGANAMGMDGLLVAGGIHKDQFGLVPGGETADPERIDRAIPRDGPQPTAIMADFRW